RLGNVGDEELDVIEAAEPKRLVRGRRTARRPCGRTKKAQRLAASDHVRHRRLLRPLRQPDLDAAVAVTLLAKAPVDTGERSVHLLVLARGPVDLIAFDPE